MLNQKRGVGILLDFLQANDRGIQPLEEFCQSYKAPPTQKEWYAKDVEGEQGELLGQEWSPPAG